MRKNILSILLLLTVFPAYAETPVFKFTDYIERNWENEFVEYDLKPEVIAEIADKKLVDKTGKEILFDIHNNKLRFLANIAPFSTNTYSFVEGKAVLKTDIEISENTDYIELSNAKAGIRILKKLSGRATPVLAWRLADGNWAGKTEFLNTEKIKGYTVNVVEKGRVRAKVNARVVFSNGDLWETSYSLQAFDPAIKVYEKFTAKENHPFKYIFNHNTTIKYALSRSSSTQPFKGKKYNYGDYIKQNLEKLSGDIVFLYPWLYWGGNASTTTSFSLIDKNEKNLFFLATSRPEIWVNPDTPKALRANTRIVLQKNTKESVYIIFDLKNGEREYLIGSLDPKRDLENIKLAKNVPTQVQRLQMKYSDFPLNEVKDFVLAWKQPENTSVSFIAKDTIENLKKNYDASTADWEYLLKQKFGLQQLEEYIPVYLATKDKRIEKKLINEIKIQVKTYLNQLTRLNTPLISVGMAPHHFREMITVCNMISLFTDSSLWTKEDRAKIFAQLAFMSYIFNTSAYSSLKRGYAGFINMTTCVYAVRSAIASVLQNHPMQKIWSKNALRDTLGITLDKWFDKNGDFVGTYTESYSYNQLSFDLILGVLYRSYLTGIDKKSLFDPRVKKMGDWFAQASTPRDLRLLNWRHYPPLGNVPKFTSQPALFAMLAVFFKDSDPEFAANMKWMQLQHGNEQVQAVGGFTPSFAGYRQIYLDNKIKPKAPHYESHHFKQSSVILRNHYATKYENQLYLIVGDGRSHYDQDSGSITIWGKGEIVADDFGYYGYAPANDHNMIDSVFSNPRGVMQVDVFAKSKYVDYVAGTKEAWTRQILFVKNDNPKAPQYYLVNDTMIAKAKAFWRLWLTAKAVKVTAAGSEVTGIKKVDTDIYFARLPNKSKVTKEKKTRKPFGLNKWGEYHGVEPSTQTGLIVETPKFDNLLTLILPRLKKTKKAKVTSIAAGKGFKVTTAYGADYVFLAKDKFTFKNAEISFTGTAGLARSGKGGVFLELQDKGEILFKGKHLEKKDSLNVLNKNLIPDGELENGEYSIFPKQGKGRFFKVNLLEKLPAEYSLSEESALKGKYCQKVVITKNKQKQRHFLHLKQQKIYVDPQKTYRVQARVFIPQKNLITLSSHALNGKGKQIPGWGWSLNMEGPTNGFKTFTTTIGPKGSGAEITFNSEVIMLTTIGIRMYYKGNTFFIDELKIEVVN